MAAEGIYRICHCRAEATTDPVTGKRKPGRLLGQECPERDRKGHTKWYARYDVPTADGKRRQVRAGPYDTEKQATGDRREALTEKASGRPADDKNTLMSDYLDRWLAWSVTRPARPLKPSTAASYREAIELYFKPALGHHKVGDLREVHLQRTYAAMAKVNTPAEEGSRDEYLRRMVAARATWHGRRTSTRPLTGARVLRVHAVLRAALNKAKIPFNPAADLDLGKKARTRKPMLWTAPRVEQWRKTGQRPAASMVWTPAQAGAFLDSIEDDRLYSLYHLAAYWGMRRSELAGLAWSDVDLDNRHVHVLQAQVDDELDSTKSEDSDRIITIDGPPEDRDDPDRRPSTQEVLRTWHEHQLFERLEWGDAWTDSGRVFTREDGSPLRPEWISEHFAVLVRRAGLPEVRLHDLRHGAASMQLANGTPLKVVSENLGHSTSSFTADTYITVTTEMAEDAARRMYIPRGSRTEAA